MPKFRPQEAERGRVTASHCISLTPTHTAHLGDSAKTLGNNKCLLNQRLDSHTHTHTHTHKHTLSLSFSFSLTVASQSNNSSNTVSLSLFQTNGALTPPRQGAAQSLGTGVPLHPHSASAHVRPHCAHACEPHQEQLLAKCTADGRRGERDESGN